MPFTELPPSNPPPADEDPAAALWRAGRDAAREDVRSIFALRSAPCPNCGAVETTNSTRCARCGTAYAERRRRGPSRRGWLALAAGSLAIAGLGALVVARFAPELRRATDRNDQLAARGAAAAERSARTALVAAQAPRFGHDRPAPTGPARLALAARARLLHRAQSLITADVDARARSGVTDRRAVATVCEPSPDTAARLAAERDPAVTDLTYSCLAVQAQIVPNPSTRGGAIGLPFYLRIHTDTGALAWCASHPPAGERGLQSELLLPPPSPVCAGR